jgi:hypothetical protein
MTSPVAIGVVGPAPVLVDQNGQHVITSLVEGGGSGDVEQVTATSPLVATPGTSGSAVYNVALAANVQPAIIAASVAALSAVNVASLGLQQGSLAVVNTVGALWTYEPAGGQTVDNITVCAATGGPSGAQWWRGPTVVAVAAAAQVEWFINPSSGSDEASGASTGAALKSFAELVRRLGTEAPPGSPNGPVIVQWLDSAPANDVVSIAPTSGILLLQGATTVSATLTLTAFTARNHAAGTLGTIEVAGHAWTPGTLVHDTTQNATFWVIADEGGGVATISQPMSLPLSASSTQVALEAGDALELLTMPTITVGQLGSLGAGIIIASTLEFDGQGGLSSLNLVEFTECHPSNGLYNCAVLGGLQPPFFMSCYVDEQTGGAGAIVGKATLFAGVLLGIGSTFATDSVFDQDVVVLERQHAEGTINLGAVYLGQFFENDGGEENTLSYVVQSDSGGSNGVLYGPAAIAVSAGQRMFVDGTATESLLCTGQLSIAGLTTAFTFNRTTGAYVGPSAVSVANIDAAGGMQDPLTGAAIIIV